MDLNHFSDIPFQVQEHPPDGRWFSSFGNFWAYTWIYIPSDENLWIYNPNYTVE